MKKLLGDTKIILVLIITIRVFGVVGGCKPFNGQDRLPAMVAESTYDSMVAKYERNDSLSQVTNHKLYAIDSELVVINNKWQDSVKALRKTLFLAEFRLARIDYHLNLVIAHPSKFEKDLQGWVDRDAHYELNLDDGAAIRKTLFPQAKIDIDQELNLK